MHLDHSLVHNKNIKAINKRVKSLCFLLQTCSAFPFSVLLFFLTSSKQHFMKFVKSNCRNISVSVFGDSYLVSCSDRSTNHRHGNAHHLLLHKPTHTHTISWWFWCEASFIILLHPNTFLIPMKENHVYSLSFTNSSWGRGRSRISFGLPPAGQKEEVSHIPTKLSWYRRLQFLWVLTTEWHADLFNLCNSKGNISLRMWEMQRHSHDV